MPDNGKKEHPKAPKITVETGQIDVSGIEDEVGSLKFNSLEDRVAPSIVAPGLGDAIEGAEDMDPDADPTAGDPEPGDDYTGDPEPGDDIPTDPPPPEDPGVPPEDPINPVP